jgi:hypothetical protein
VAVFAKAQPEAKVKVGGMIVKNFMNNPLLA